MILDQLEDTWTLTLPGLGRRMLPSELGQPQRIAISYFWDEDSRLVEVEVGPAVALDIDTPEALAAIGGSLPNN